MRAFLLVFLLLSAPAGAAEMGDRRLVEIGAGFADAPTLRLTAAITEALERSEELKPSTGQKPGTLMISFTNPVEAREHMGRTEYLYRVELRGVNGRLFERGTGNCWSDEIARCVFTVVRLANRFAPRE